LKKGRQINLAENNFWIDLIASLNKKQSKKQIQADAKNLGDIKVPLIGTLNKAKTKSQLKKDLASLNGTVNLTGKVDKKGVTTSVQQATQQAQKKVNAHPIEINFSVKKEKLINDIKLLGQQNSRLFKDAGMASKYNTLLDNAQLASSTQELNSLRLQLSAFRSEIKVTGNTGMTFIDALKSGLSKVLQLFGGYNIIMQFTAQLRNAWKEASELDSALTDLSRVNSEISRSDFPNYLDKVINKTKELSVATKDYIDAVTTFSRAGYNLMDSETLADMAMQLEKVGDMDAESASKALLSGLQGYAEIDGYGMDQLAEKAQALNDKIDIIGNTASISQKEVAEGIQAVGSVMADANTSVDEFLALLGAANRTVQDSNKVALAIRTSALRIRGCTAELQEMGEETDNVIESTSTLAAKIKALTNIDGSGGVNILEADEETFRSIYDIYNDISKVYNKMSDMNASALLDLIAGKNRSNQISAVLNNMSEANELLDRSLNATGTASNEYQIYLDSAKAATERFGVAMTETYNNIINGETVKSLANAGTAVLNFANSFGIVEGTIKGFLTLGILKGITTLTVAFKNSAVQVSKYGVALSTVNKLDTIRGTQKFAEAMNILKTSCIGLTEVQLKQVLANKALGESERIAILMERGLTEAQAQAKLAQLGLTQTTNAQTAANGAATASTFSLKAAVTGLGASIKTAFMSNPIGITVMAISMAIGAVTSAISKIREAGQKANEAMEEAVSEYESAKSSLESVNSELEEQNKKLDELLAKDKLTYAEKGQLEELQAITKELLLQKDIEEKRTENASKEAAEKAVDAFDKQYGKFDKTEDDLKEKLSYENFPMPEDEDDVLGMVASYVRAKELLEQSQSNFDNALQNGEDTTLLADDLQYNIDAIEDCSQALDENLSDLWDKRTALENEYNKAIAKRDTGIEPLTTSDGEVIETYESIYSLMEMIYRYTDPNTWKSMQIEDVFNTEGIEKTKEELVEMVKAGTLDESTLQSYPKLSKALEQNKVSASELRNELAALADAEGNVKGNTSPTPFLSITDTVDQINTQLKPSLDSLKDAYQNIFTFDDDTGEKLFSLEDVGVDTFETIKSSLDELGKIDGITVDYSTFEDFVSVLSDSSSTADEVQEQFNKLATSIIYTTDCTNMTAETYDLLIQSMKSLGITNAGEVLLNLKNIQEELINAGYNLSDITAEEAARLVEFEMISAEAAEYLKMYLVQKELAQNPLNTSADIMSLQNLCNTLGVTSELYEYVISLKRAFDAKEMGAGGDIDASIEHIKGRIAELSKGKGSYTFSFDGMANPSKSKSSKSKSGKEEDLWLKEYKEKLAELQNQLGKEIINEREFFSQSEILLNTYLKDSQEHMEKYADEISDAEKTLHDNMVSAYQYEADELGRLRDGNYLDMVGYYQSMMGLQDSYYNSEALKLKNLADTMEAEYGRMSHINLTRPSVDASAVREAGYTTDLESSNVYAQSFGNEEKQVVVTPVLPDGTILSPETLMNYAGRLLKGEKIDTDIELAIFDGADAVKQASEYISGLEKIQSEYSQIKDTFSQSPYGDFTEEQLEALEKLTEEIEKHKSQLSSELGDIKSAYDGLIEIRDTYNEYGKISVDQYQSLCDMGFEYLALLSDESGALSLDEDAFQRLTDAKVQQMQVDMALQAADLINNIQTEAQAVQYLAASYDNLANNALSAAEKMLYAAQANAQLMYGAESMQAQAADTIVKGYENSKLLVGNVGNVDVKMQSGGGYKEEKEEKEKEKEPEIRDWAEIKLERIEKGLEKTAGIAQKISDQTGRLTDKVEKFFSWQKKNAMINRAVKSTDKEIKANQNQISQTIKALKSVKNVSSLYSQKLDSIKLPDEYKNKIKNGALQIEDIADEDLQESIKTYEEWYDKLNDCKDKMKEYEDSIQECRDAVSDLYDQQRDLIRQKLDNVLSYYSDMDSYLSSITSKVESLISLNDDMGKRSSLTELVEQFASLSDQINSVTTKEIAGVTITEGSLGDSKKVADAVERDRQELVDSIQSDIDNLSVDQSGSYTKLLKNIAKTEAQVDKYIDKGWDVKKSKQFDKLIAKLQDYYDLQSELDEWATSNTITNYQKVYTAYQKLQNKLDSGRDLSKSEWKKYNSYQQQIEDLKAQGQTALNELYTELAEANGTAAKKSEADKIKEELSGIQSDLENSATYQRLLKTIQKTEDKLAALDEKGYDNLSKKQKKTYDKLETQLEVYYAQKESLDGSATAANIAEYNKIYLAWRKLQDRLDKGKNLSVNEWKKYNQYTDQLEQYSKDKADTLSKLNDDLAEALNPSDKLKQIEKVYEESAEGIYESYHNQIDTINDEAENTQQYQNLQAKAQKLEQKKDTKGLSKSEQATLDKYNEELEALRQGATGTNITDYMKKWEALYKLQQKLDKGKTLSASEAKKYDTYKAQLEAWNNEKQTQINDLLSLMEDEIEQLDKTYAENVAKAKSEMDAYYANLYSLAKQIAEYNISSLKSQLDCLDSFISYYKEIISLYDTFSGDKLTKILTDLDENTLSGEVEVYEKYLDTLQEKYNTTLSEMNEYGQLLDALDTNDFASSMELFNKAMADYRTKGNTAMADKLQSVLDLLNERAVDADNWGEYADQWQTEWETALASAKQELIGTSTEIQNVNDALREIRFDNITNAIEELDTARNLLSSIESLIQEDWLFDDGELSEYGQAKAALLVSQLEAAQMQADEYLKFYNEIQNSEDTYASEKAYKEELNDALQNYYNSLNDAASLENSIMELMKKSSEEELNSIKDIIDARKKALQAKKEYYDYDKTIKNSQKEIDSIKAQIIALEALSDATDAATKAKLAQLKADLTEKEDALQETKDEHTYNLQIDALDEFAASLEDTLNNSTKSLEEILREQREIIESAKDLYRTSSDNVDDTLDKLTAFYNGMGISIDGTDLAPSGTGNTGTGSTGSISVNVGNNSTAEAIKGNTEAMEDVMISLDDVLTKGVPIRNLDGQYIKVAEQNMPICMDNFLAPMLNTIKTLPEMVKNTPPVVNNYNYDCLLKVEGNVDKNALPELKVLLEKSYKYTTDKIYRETMHLR